MNQLLSKIDGVDSLNNILIIGMTNRKDMIDEAILRPGRLEVGPALNYLELCALYIAHRILECILGIICGWFLADSY